MRCGAKDQKSKYRCSSLPSGSSRYCDPHQKFHQSSWEDYKRFSSGFFSHPLTDVKSVSDAKKYDSWDEYNRTLRLQVPHLRMAIKLRENHTSNFYTLDSDLPEDIPLREEYSDCVSDPERAGGPSAGSTHNLVLKRFRKAFEFLEPLYLKWRDEEFSRKESIEQVPCPVPADSLAEEDLDDPDESQESKVVYPTKNQMKNLRKKVRKLKKQAAEARKEAEAVSSRVLDEYARFSQLKRLLFLEDVKKGLHFMLDFGGNVEEMKNFHRDNFSHRPFGVRWTTEVTEEKSKDTKDIEVALTIGTTTVTARRKHSIVFTERMEIEIKKLVWLMLLRVSRPQKNKDKTKEKPMSVRLAFGWVFAMTARILLKKDFPDIKKYPPLYFSALPDINTVAQTFNSRISAKLLEKIRERTKVLVEDLLVLKDLQDPTKGVAFCVDSIGMYLTLAGPPPDKKYPRQFPE